MEPCTMHLRGGGQRGGRQQQRRDPSELRGLGCGRWRGCTQEEEGCRIRGLKDQLGAESAIRAARGGSDKGAPPQGGGQLGGRRPSLLPSTLYGLRRGGWGLVGLGSGWARSHEGGELVAGRSSLLSSMIHS